MTEEGPEPKNPDPILCRVSFPVTGTCPCFEVSNVHPNLHLEVEGCLHVGNGHMIERVRIHNPPPEVDVKEAFRQHPAVKEVNTVLSTTESTVHELTVPVCSVIRIHERLKIMPTYPFHIKDGRESIVVTGSNERIREFISEIREAIPGLQVDMVSRTRVDGSEGILTDRQREIFHIALSAGYWDIPRRTTLSQMASNLSISKSTLSEHISMIERKLLHLIEEQHRVRL